MTYVCILFFCIVSVTGRIAINEIKDDISNLIVDIKPVNDVQNKTASTTASVQNKTDSAAIHNNLLDNNLLDHPASTNVSTENSCVSSNDSKCEVLNKRVEFKVDNGTALILTNYIKESKVKEARALSKVDPSLFLGIKSHSGFFTVNETYNSNIFFWYFPVLNKSVSEAPWIIWLQGGPGASSLVGLFDEIGPFTVINDNLKLNPYTWLTNHSLLFIDNPVGTGYSFTDNEDGYVTDMATYGAHLYSTLTQFLSVFPELKTAPLYIAGESYAGKYVPAMAMEIHRRIQKKEDVGINLQGMIIGNAYVDPAMISQTAGPFYYFGLIEKEQMDTLKPLADSFRKDVKANNSIEAKKKWNSLMTLLIFWTHQKHGYNFLRDEVPIGKFKTFLSKSEVKRAIHVGDIYFDFLNVTVNVRMASDFLSTTKPLFEKLLEHYKVLAYCGQLDQMLPCVFTSENYRTWKWNGAENFLNATRFPYTFNNRLSGYYKTGGQLTEVVFRGAGHMAPIDTPAPVRNLVTKWTHNQPLGHYVGQFLNSYIQEYVANNSLTYYL